MGALSIYIYIDTNYHKSHSEDSQNELPILQFG